jgi:hypothetical protein
MRLNSLFHSITWHRYNDASRLGIGSVFAWYGRASSDRGMCSNARCDDSQAGVIVDRTTRFCDRLRHFLLADACGCRAQVLDKGKAVFYLRRRGTGTYRQRCSQSTQENEGLGRAISRAGGIDEVWGYRDFATHQDRRRIAALDY